MFNEFILWSYRGPWEMRVSVVQRGPRERAQTVFASAVMLVLRRWGRNASNDAAKDNEPQCRRETRNNASRSKRGWNERMEASRTVSGSCLGRRSLVDEASTEHTGQNLLPGRAIAISPRPCGSKVGGARREALARGMPRRGLVGHNAGARLRRQACDRLMEKVEGLC